jgi:hypothetical protein
MHYALSVSDCGSVDVLRELVKENLKLPRWRDHPNKGEEQRLTMTMPDTGEMGGGGMDSNEI